VEERDGSAEQTDETRTTALTGNHVVDERPTTVTDGPRETVSAGSTRRG
jgi:hypothetical protein